MKQKNMMKSMTAGALAILLCVLAVMPAYAAFDPPMPWAGSVSGGVFVADGQSELAIEQAELTFDIADLLQESYTDAQALLAYGAQVSATYTIYNPTDHAVTEQLATPMGTYPNPSESIPEGTDAKKFTVAVNGTQITPQLRHTFTHGTGYYESAPNMQNPDVHLPDFGLAYLSDTLLSHPIFTPDAPVYVYTYRVEMDESEKEKNFVIRAEIPADAQSCALLIPWYAYDSASTPDKVSIFQTAYISEDITICSVGKPMDAIEWKTETYKNKEFKASVKQTSLTQMTLYEYVMQGYDAQSGVSLQDYFNAFLAYTDKYKREDSAAYNVGDQSPLPDYYLQPWQLFSVELAPGERASVTLTAPLYPSLYDRYDPPIYIYAYAMAHKEEWSAYGQTSVQVITQHHLLDREQPMPNDSEYTKTEQGYHWQGDAEFPYLVFSTCEVQKPSDGSTWVAAILLILIILFLFIVYVLPWVILALVILLVVFLIIRAVKKRKKKKAKRENLAQVAQQKEEEHAEEQENQEKQE